MFFQSMGHGAWEQGMNGPSRLDYQTVVNILFDQRGIKKKHRKALFADLQIMEVPALNAMHENPNK